MSASLDQWAEEQLAGLPVSITHLVTDSRAVRPGDTFVAYPGEKLDGRQFIAQAIEQGANAVIYEKHMSGHPLEANNFSWNKEWLVPNLPVADLRHKAGWLADAVYSQPTEALWMVGITGTNGKTSTSHWIAQALNDAGKKCALIGTLGNGFADALQSSANTTPEALRVHGLCAEYLDEGAQAVAMEVSSHALAQGRVNGVRFDVAMLTNLSRDHLDYHGDMQSYAGSKRKLFDWQGLKYAVLNLDDAFGAELAEQLSLQEGGRRVPGGSAATNPHQDEQVEVVGYGISDSALQLAERLGVRMVYGSLLEMSGQGMRIAIHTSWGAAELDSELIGRFNAENLMGALAVLLVSDVALMHAVQVLGKVQPVAGRMQRLGGKGQPTVIVDYAHSPDALEKVLTTLRDVGSAAGGKLICVFGCGGDRDRGKRAMMGLVAERYADHCIITSDNPRSEDPLDIIAEILSGMSAGNHEVIADREQAISHAVGCARQQDTILVAGKGHEDYQEICGVKQRFSDVQVAMQALQQKYAGVRT